MIFLSQGKTFMKSFIQKRLTCKTAIAERFSKTYNKKKIFNKQFHHCEASIFVEKATKSKNAQTDIKSSSNDNLNAKFYKNLSNEVSPTL